ncbi:MAG: DNA replication and repair protein RecF [Chlamydiae bacterium]|nr:DNA replication and repair protein RecF [Chlamydiota bacterium]
MKIRFISISNFRGFEKIELKPRDHVLLVGGPGAGRSDLIEALWRVLSAESSRYALLEDLDFFNRDLAKRIEIEVVLGDLGPHLEQAFLDRLELWDLDTGQLIQELSPGSDRDPDSLENVVRFCYRAVWDSDQQQARQWVDFPKFSDPEGEYFHHVPRILREELPVAFVSSSGLPLSLGARGDLRKLINAQDKTDFPGSLDRLIDGIAELAEGIVQSQDLAKIIERILEPLRIPLGLGDRSASDILQFAPEGGSLASILRGLQPIMKLREDLGFLPLIRHGSTLRALLQLSQALARSDSSDAVIVVDDFGENIDIDIAQHLASILQNRAAQLWLSTLRGSVGQCFRLEDMVRLTVSSDGVRCAHIGQVPVSKAERLALRHLHLQILPAISSQAVVVVEGPHDRSVLAAAAVKLNMEEGVPLPASQRIAFLDAGAAEGSGGVSAIPRLASLARNLGFHVIAIIDCDRDAEAAEQHLIQNLEAANVVIRWPQGYAIEKALLNGLDEEDIRTALKDLSEAHSIPLGFDPNTLSAGKLVDRAMRFLKSSGGLHAPFVDALPENCIPPLVRKCLEEIPQAINKTGLVQL